MDKFLFQTREFDYPYSEFIINLKDLAEQQGEKVIIIGLQKPQICDLEDVGWHEKSIIGSQYTTEIEFMKGIQLAGDGKLKLLPLITHTFSIAEINDAFRLLTERTENVIKVIIKPSL